jgi:hypothetical protein
MWYRRSQYINLKDSPSSKTDQSEKKYRLFSPLIQLEGSKGRKLWKRPNGIFIQKRSSTEGSPRLSFSSLWKALIYAISFLIFAIGYLFKHPGDGGQFNGGQA